MKALKACHSIQNGRKLSHRVCNSSAARVVFKSLVVSLDQPKETFIELEDFVSYASTAAEQCAHEIELEIVACSGRNFDFYEAQASD